MQASPGWQPNASPSSALRPGVPAHKVLEQSQRCAYIPGMTDITQTRPVPAGWLEILDESEADLAAGRIVPGEVVHQGLRDSLARLEAKRAARLLRGASARG